MQLDEAAVVDMRVDLGRGDIGMAEHLLDDTQVGAALEQVAGERVAQHVRVDGALDAGAPGGITDDGPDAFAGQGAPADGEEHRDGARGGVELRPDLGEVRRERLAGRDAERDEALFVALPLTRM